MQVFVASESEQAIYVIRGSGRRRGLAGSGDAGRSGPAPTGSLYVALDAGEGIDVLDTKMGTHTGCVFRWSRYTTDACVDGGRCRQSPAVSSVATRNAAILDLDAGRMGRTFTDFNNYLILAIDSTRGRWYTNDYDSESTAPQWLVAVDMETGQEIGRCPLGGDPRQAVVDPATGMIYVANSWSNTVSVIEPDGVVGGRDDSGWPVPDEPGAERGGGPPVCGE